MLGEGLRYEVLEVHRCIDEGRDCRTCLAYRLGSLCAKDMKHLLHDPATCSSDDTVVAEVLRQIQENEDTGNGDGSPHGRA